MTRRGDRVEPDEAMGLLPLKPATFHILLALAGGPAHGYAIRQEVEERTDGAVRLWPATLYGTIGRLVDGGLIEETDVADAPDDDVQRRFYRLTAAGDRVLAAEADRLASLVRLARARRSTPRPGAA